MPFLPGPHRSPETAHLGTPCRYGAPSDQAQDSAPAHSKLTRKIQSNRLPAWRGSRALHLGVQGQQKKAISQTACLLGQAYSSAPAH
eukprot:280840-Pelagomonas_calceolata.AAC.2